jgi:NCAIR mutase (PurE)-related protein
MDSDGDATKLSQDQVEQVMRRAQGPLEPCMVEARRRDPEMVQARVEVVVDQRGRILASRVNGKRYSPLARCMHRRLRPIRFPRSGVRRTVAAFTIGIPH